MALSLEKYAELLDQRNEPRPVGPDPIPFPRAKPHLPRMGDLRAVVYGGFGSLMLLSGGKIHFLNPDPVMQRISLEKTIQEFKMWQSMSRKPGEPSKYMASIFQQILDGLLMGPAGAKDAELRIEIVWQAVIERLLKKEYTYDEATYGQGVELAKKVSYYYLLASQGIYFFPQIGGVLREIKSRGLRQGVHSAGQCATPVRLLRELSRQSQVSYLGEVLDAELCLWTHEAGVKKEADRFWALLSKSIDDAGLETKQVLYVGAQPELEIAPAKRRGFRTALFLADKASAEVSPEHLKQDRTRPDALLTRLDQILEVLPH